MKRNIVKGRKPRCYRCGRLADYCAHGAAWVCLRCRPWPRTGRTMGMLRR